MRCLCVCLPHGRHLHEGRRRHPHHLGKAVHHDQVQRVRKPVHPGCPGGLDREDNGQGQGILREVP
ncbi:MAG: hypothetical protein MZU79_09035 [Anaerotruncus sp.]|nr:hypothetical protein [Anaerotruncus sp.]